MIKAKKIAEWALKFIVLLTLYAAIEISMSAIDPNLKPFYSVWLSGGMAIGLLSLWSVSLIPAVFFGSFIANGYLGVPLEGNILIACSYTVGIIVFFGALKLWKVKADAIDERSHNRVFFLVTLLSMLIPAGLSGLYFRGQENCLFFCFSLWVSYCAGILIVAKLIVETTLRNIVITASDLIDIRVLMSATGLIGLAFYIDIAQVSYVFDFLCFLVLTLLSFKYSPLLSHSSAILVVILAVIRCNLDVGIYETLSDKDGNIYLISFIGCTSLLVYFIGNVREDALRFSLAKEELKKENEIQMLYLKAVVHSIPDLLIEVDKNNNCIAANGSSPISIFSVEKLIGLNLKEVLSKEAHIIWCKAIEDAKDWNFSRGKVIEIIENHKSYWFELSITKRVTDEAESFTFICIARDITKRLENHNADLANEKRFRNIFDSIENISVQGYNRTHEVIYWNKASEVLYGYTKEEALGRKLEDLIIPAHLRHMVHQDIENWHSENKAIPAGELALRDKKGETVFVYSNHVMIKTHNEKEMFCIDIDIGGQRRALAKAEEELTHRKLTENSLRESDRRFKRAQIMSNIAHWSWSPISNQYTINELALNFINIPSEDLLGDMSYFLEKYVILEDRTKFNLEYEACKLGKTIFDVEVGVVVDELTYRCLLKGQSIEKDGSMMFDGILQAKLS